MNYSLHTFAKNDQPKILHLYVSSSFPLTFSPFLSVENRVGEGRKLKKLSTESQTDKIIFVTCVGK